MSVAGPPEVRLREVAESDLPLFYEYQIDPESVRLAAVPPRDLETFRAHWQKILAADTVLLRTILCDGQVAGHAVSFELAQGHREVGYWIGRSFWGRGVASTALAAFLEVEARRPLYAHVAQHNAASRRVAEKCGFKLLADDPNFSNVGDRVVPGFILELA